MARPFYLALSLVVFAVLANAGSIQGHVSLTKRLTKRKVPRLSYELRGVPVKAAAEPEIRELDETAIFLDGPGVRVAPNRGAPPTAHLDQKDGQFSPEILIVPVGSTVVFPNSDPIFHNVFSLSKIRSFDLGFYPAGQSRAVKFERPGIVRVYCHIHSDMSAVIVVAPGQWYTKPDQDGKFKIAGVPPGAYSLVVWHKSGGSLTIPVQVPETGAVNVEAVLPVFDPRKSR